MTVVPIREARAEPDHDRLTDEIIALIKGMLIRGDKQSDIAACFLVNGGRISEINNGLRGKNIGAASEKDLPPAGPYPSFYDLMRNKRDLWRVRIALESANETIIQALNAVHKVENR